MPSKQENWHRGQNSLEPVSYSFCWIEEKYFETKSTSGWPSHLFGLYILSTHIFIRKGKIYWWRLLLLFVRWADSGGWSVGASFASARVQSAFDENKSLSQDVSSRPTWDVFTFDLGVEYFLLKMYNYMYASFAGLIFQCFGLKNVSFPEISIDWRVWSYMQFSGF